MSQKEKAIKEFVISLNNNFKYKYTDSWKLIGV